MFGKIKEKINNGVTKMRKYEFKEFIENDLDREIFEEVALRQIRESYIENDNKKELSENQEKQLINQMWSSLIDNIYQKVKNEVKSDDIEYWKLKIKELNVVEQINNSFQEY